jgi:uncharacterized membrane protein
VTPDPAFETRALLWGNLLLALCVGLYVVSVYTTSGAAGLAEMASTAGVSLAITGKLVIFWGLKKDALPIWSLAVMTFLIDMVFAFALASGLRGLERAPLIGRWLHSSRMRAKLVLVEYPGLKRLAFFGVVAFVLLPIAGTGAITGSIVARLLGLSRLAGIAAVALASGWSASAFALLAYFVGDQAQAILANKFLVGGILVFAAVLAWIVYRRVLAELRRQA